MSRCVPRFTSSERCRIYIKDPDENGLLTTVKTGETIRVSIEGSIAGLAFENGPLIVNDPQNDERFYQDVGEGFIERNVCAVPLGDSEKRIGVIEIINKLNVVDKNDSFREADMNSLAMLARIVSQLL